MKHFKSIITVLVLAIMVAGMTNLAMAQKEPIKSCPKCGKVYKGTHKCPKAEKPKPKPKPDRKPTPKPKPKPTPKQPKRSADEIINDYLNSMVYVEGGTFTMGATSEQGSDAYDDEKPTHSVTLSSYYIGKTEVTEELWEAVMGSNPSIFSSGAKYPVTCVSWDDCQEFIRKLNAKTGKNFRLPTEAEWEYAARGGNRSHGYKYSGSNDIDDVAWYDEHGIFSHPVATKCSNELGIYDMSGNVWEWCNDWYGEDYYKSSPSKNPQGPTSGTERVVRGGCTVFASWRCYVWRRESIKADDDYAYIGFRLAL